MARMTEQERKEYEDIDDMYADSDDDAKDSKEKKQGMLNKLKQKCIIYKKLFYETNIIIFLNSFVNLIILILPVFTFLGLG